MKNKKFSLLNNFREWHEFVLLAIHKDHRYIIGLSIGSLHIRDRIFSFLSIAKVIWKKCYRFEIFFIRYEYYYEKTVNNTNYE